MKSSSRTQSATSLPRAPRDEIDARTLRYLGMMALRTVCFVLMVVVTPYGWYTWVFGLAAIFLPYLAVVGANVGQESRRNRREDPGVALAATPPAAPAATEAQVIRIHEVPVLDAPREAAAHEAPATEAPAPDDVARAPREDGDPQA